MTFQTKNKRNKIRDEKATLPLIPQLDITMKNDMLTIGKHRKKWANVQIHLLTPAEA